MSDYAGLAFELGKLVSVGVIGGILVRIWDQARPVLAIESFSSMYDAKMVVPLNDRLDEAFENVSLIQAPRTTGVLVGDLFSVAEEADSLASSIRMVQEEMPQTRKHIDELRIGGDPEIHFFEIVRSYWLTRIWLQLVQFGEIRLRRSEMALPVRHHARVIGDRGGTIVVPFKKVVVGIGENLSQVPDHAVRLREFVDVLSTVDLEAISHLLDESENFMAREAPALATLKAECARAIEPASSFAALASVGNRGKNPMYLGHECEIVLHIQKTREVIKARLELREQDEGGKFGTHKISGLAVVPSGGVLKVMVRVDPDDCGTEKLTRLVGQVRLGKATGQVVLRRMMNFGWKRRCKSEAAPVSLLPSKMWAVGMG